MISLRLLLTLYISSGLLWSLIIIWYLNQALVSQYQPSWLRTVIKNHGMSEIVLYGSIMLSPMCLLFLTIISIKKIIKGEKL